MPGTVNDFLERFSGGNQAVDDREAHQYYDRFASQHHDDRDFDCETMYDGATEYLGQLPDDHFHRATERAYDQAPPQQRHGMFQTLLEALQGRGASIPSGFSSADPRSMSGSQYAQLANYARREHPEALRETVKEHPGFLKMLGNPMVSGALAVVAAKMLQRQHT
jgi:hypothetical protein